MKRFLLPADHHSSTEPPNHKQKTTRKSTPRPPQQSVLLGQGAFGTVHLVRPHKSSTLVCAQKTVFDWEAYVREMAVMAALSGCCPFVVAWHDRAGGADDTRVYTEQLNAHQFRMEAHKSDLRSLLKRTPWQVLIPPKAREWTLQLLTAVAALHARGFCHRDISLSNILVSASDHLVLADLGMARMVAGHAVFELVQTDRVAQLWCRPPEIFRYRKYDGYAVDLWQVGCVVAHLLHLFPTRSEQYCPHRGPYTAPCAYDECPEMLRQQWKWLVELLGPPPALWVSEDSFGGGDWCCRRCPLSSVLPPPPPPPPEEASRPLLETLVAQPAIVASYSWAIPLLRGTLRYDQREAADLLLSRMLGGGGGLIPTSLIGDDRTATTTAWERLLRLELATQVSPNPRIATTPPLPPIGGPRFGGTTAERRFLTQWLLAVVESDSAECDLPSLRYAHVLFAWGLLDRYYDVCTAEERTPTQTYDAHTLGLALAALQLSFFIRGHQCVDNGYPVLLAGHTISKNTLMEQQILLLRVLQCQLQGPTAWDYLSILHDGEEELSRSVCDTWWCLPEEAFPRTAATVLLESASALLLVLVTTGAVQQQRTELPPRRQDNPRAALAQHCWEVARLGLQPPPSFSSLPLFYHLTSVTWGPQVTRHRNSPDGRLFPLVSPVPPPLVRGERPSSYILRDPSVDRELLLLEEEEPVFFFISVRCVRRSVGVGIGVGVGVPIPPADDARGEGFLSPCSCHISFLVSDLTAIKMI